MPMDGRYPRNAWMHISRVCPRTMFRMNKFHGKQDAGSDGRYDAVPWMAKSGVIQVYKP